jgi:thiol-disulfide isomerase/thioredoxin
MNLTKCLIGILLLSFTKSTYGQLYMSSDTLLQVGKPIPDFFLNDILYYKKKEAFPKDFKGKWLVLDFWDTKCINCIQSFPKINSLQQRFYKNIQFCLIGVNDIKYNKDIKLIYEKFRRKLNLQLAIAYDSTLVKQFNIGSFPRMIIIDEQSIVRVITTSVDEDNIQALLEGKHSNFPLTNADREPFDRSKLLLVNGNGGNDTDFLYRSIITKWKPSTDPSAPITIDAYIKKGRFQGTGMFLWWLYNYAYLGKSQWIFGDSLYGKTAILPVLEVKDSSLFRFDLNTGQGLYNYSLSVIPEKATRQYLMELMQKDLNSFFGYDVKVEIRKVPYWKLVNISTNISKLKSKGGDELYEYSHAGFKYVNVPIVSIINAISSLYPYDVFVDESGIVDKIDISINAILTDIEEVKKELQKNGLDLIKGEKEMKRVVIRDHKPN